MIRRAHHRLFTVAVVRADLSEALLPGLHTRQRVDLLLARGWVLRVHQTEQV